MQDFIPIAVLELMNYDSFGLMKGVQARILEELNDMKKQYWISLVSFATAVVGIGVSANSALAQGGPLSNAAPAPAFAPQAPPAAPAGTPAPALPYGVSEVVKMYQGGINKEVLIGYVDNSVLPFHLNADAIIYLQHLGLPQEVTAAMIRRDGDLQKQGAAAYQQQAPGYPQQAPAGAPLYNGAPPYNQQPPAASAAPQVVMPSTPPHVMPYTYSDAAPPVAYPD